MSSDNPNNPPYLPPAAEEDLSLARSTEHGQLPHASGVHTGVARVFLGAEGLRAGWGCLLFCILLFLLTYVGKPLARLLLHGNSPKRGAALSPSQLILGELLSVVMVVLATFLMSRLEGRRFLSFGLGGRASVARFAGGLVSGFAAISALVGILWWRGLLTLGSAHLGAPAALRYALLWGLGFLLVACFEETLLRGYLLFTLRRGIGFWPAAVLLSALFGFVHHSNPGESPVGLFAAAAVGLVFCLAIWYTGSLWWAIGFHATWDWGESFFWSTSDSGLQVKGHLLQEQSRGPLLWSGGPTGPEGSLWVLPVLLLCAILMFLWWRRKPHSETAEPVHSALTGE